MNKSVFCGIFSDEKGQRCLLVMHKLADRVLRELYSDRQKAEKCMDDILQWDASVLRGDILWAESKCSDMASILREKMVEYVRDMRGGKRLTLKIQIPNLIDLCNKFFSALANNSYMRNGLFFGMGPLDQRFIVQDILRDTFYIFSTDKFVKVEEKKSLRPMKGIDEEPKKVEEEGPTLPDASLSSSQGNDLSGFSGIHMVGTSEAPSGAMQDKMSDVSGGDYPDESVSAVGFADNQLRELQKMREEAALESKEGKDKEEAEKDSSQVSGTKSISDTSLSSMRSEEKMSKDGARSDTSETSSKVSKASERSSRSSRSSASKSDHSRLSSDLNDLRNRGAKSFVTSLTNSTN